MERVRLSALKKMSYGAAEFHWEKRRGTPGQARDYCMKPEGRVLSTHIYINDFPCSVESDEEWMMPSHPDFYEGEASFATADTEPLDSMDI